MKLNEYQDAAWVTADFPGQEELALNYPYTKLAGEAGEFVEKCGKLMRRLRKIILTPKDIGEKLRHALLLELGDILWYVAILAKCLGSSLEEVAEMNIDKLTSRSERGVIDGEGDYR